MLRTEDFQMEYDLEFVESLEFRGITIAKAVHGLGL